MARTCSKCHETGHYKNTCRNPRADFDDDDPSVVVGADDLFMGTSMGQPHEQTVSMQGGRL